MFGLENFQYFGRCRGTELLDDIIRTAQCTLAAIILSTAFRRSGLCGLEQRRVDPVVSSRQSAVSLRFLLTSVVADTFLVSDGECKVKALLGRIVCIETLSFRKV
jgi:hypothetical protein